MNTLTTERPIEQQAIGQIAVDLPGATAIFRRLKLDFCCGGQVSLGEACERKGLDTARVVAELAALRRDDAAPETPDANALIDHILTRYHAVHREQLPELIRLARRVEQVHGDREDCPHGLANHLEAMAQELESHMRKEEQILFPMIARGHGRMAGMPIGVMRAEHNEHGAELRRLEEMTNDITPPPGACTTWRALYTGLRTFREDLMTHIHLENNVLFERFAPAAMH